MSRKKILENSCKINMKRFNDWSRQFRNKNSGIMQIKLAKYVDGKFEEFLELGKDFGYYGNFIACKRNFLSGNEINFDEDGVGFCCDLPCWVYKKDEKDPLGRFNGLFDGRTYGDGTFVLIRSFKYKNSIVWEDNFDTNYLVGNLHENPELLLRNRVLTI